MSDHIPADTKKNADDNLDKFIYGVKPIGREANLVKEDGTVDERATYHALERGYIDADKFGRKWRSTPRRIRSGGKAAS